jgi:hypothetical protein
MADLKPAESRSDMITEKPAAPAKTAPAGTAKPPQVLPGYKIVKVRKPDGAIVRVKRPLDPAEVNTPATGNATAATSGTAGAAAPKEVRKAPVVAASTPAAVASPSKESAPAKTAPGPNAQADTSTAPATTPEKTAPATVSEKPATTATTATTASPAKDAATVQPTYTPSPLANSVLQAAPKLCLLARVTRHTTRVAGAFVPDLDIGEWGEGDDMLDDEPDSDDEDFDDDGDDQRDDTDDTLDGHSESRDLAIHDEKHDTAGADSAAASYLLIGVSQIPQQQDAANQQGRSGPTVTMDKKGLAVENKEIKNESTSQPGMKPPRQLSRQPDWTRYVIWGIMILLPLLFISNYSPNK